MKLTAPFSIGSRLLPCLRVGGAEISLEMVGCRGNRSVYRWFIDLDGAEFSAADLEQPGHYASDAQADQAAFGALLAFLEACGEGLRYSESTGRESDNADLFPPAVAKWARANTDELGLLRLEIEESGAALLSDDDE